MILFFLIWAHSYTEKEIEEVDTAFLEPYHAVYKEARDVTLGRLPGLSPSQKELVKLGQVPEKKADKLVIVVVEGKEIIAPADIVHKVDDEPMPLPVTRKQFHDLAQFRQEYAAKPLRLAPIEERLKIIPLLVSCDSPLIDKVTQSILMDILDMDGHIVRQEYGEHTEPTTIEDELNLLSKKIMNEDISGAHLVKFIDKIHMAPSYTIARLHGIDINAVAMRMPGFMVETLEIAMVMRPSMRPTVEGVEALVALYPFEEDEVTRQVLVGAALKWRLELPSPAPLQAGEDADVLFKEAMKNKDLSTIHRLAMLPSNQVDSKNRNQWLFLAFEQLYHSAALILILAPSTRLDVVNENGYTPLIASLSRSFDMVHYHAAYWMLWSRFSELNIHAVHPQEGSAFTLACRAISLVIAEKILKETTVDVNIPGQNGFTPIMFAVLHEKVPLAKLLFRHGIGPSTRIPTGETVYQYATRMRRPIMLQLLKEQE